MTLLSVQDVSIAFRTRAGMVPALQGVRFDVAPGEMLGIVGASGSGKSVTALSLLGLLDASARITAGRAMFGGRDLLRLPEAALRALRGREIAMIFQDQRGALNPIRSAGQQIADVLGRHDAAPPATIRARMLMLLHQLQIADPERCARAFPHELSGGMCQRIGIAMALAGAPRLLLADEPTTGLDVITQAAIMDLLRDAVRARDAACILITHDLALAAQYCDRILEMQDGRVVGPAPTPIAPAPHPDADAPARTGRPVLEIQGLRKAFPLPKAARLAAVDGVDLRIMPGEAVGLVGQSGCGKSTLARLVTRLLEADGGTILMDGRPTAPARRDVQMVFQDPTGSLNPRFTAFEAIADPLRQLRPELDAAAIRARVAEAAADAGLPAELFARYPHQLSGGQKARVGIARAMAPGPRLLVMDEPTASLDAAVQAQVLAHLAALRRRAGVALLLISHDLAVVGRVCDRIAVMQHGRIIETGSTAQIFRAPRHPHTAALIAASPKLS